MKLNGEETKQPPELTEEEREKLHQQITMNIHRIRELEKQTGVTSPIEINLPKK